MHSTEFPNISASVRYVSPLQAITTTPSKCPTRSASSANTLPLANISFSRQATTVTIGKLSDDVILKIFRYYVDSSPRCWLRLVHVCRVWRRIVFASQRDLHLRLFCTYGTPVTKILDRWPSLPIVVEYGGSLALGPPVPEDENNIVAALKQSDRVTSIRLTVTSSFLERLSAIDRPFSELEDLVLLPQNGMRLSLPKTFRWGPRLRRLHMTRILFPSLLRLLHSSRNLVDLQLHDILNPWRFSAEALTNTLSGMTRLQSLSLHFLDIDYFLAPPLLPGERVVLPALTRFKFRGVTEYLDGFVARIDVPRLRDIEITFTNKTIFGLSKLTRFIDRIGVHKSFYRAHILSSRRAISISLIQPGAPTSLKLQLLCEPITEQLFFMRQVFFEFSTFLFNVEGLRISAMRPSRWDDSHSSGWPMSINSFTGVKRLHIAGNLSTDIVRALELDSWRATLPPTLQKLYIPQPGPRHAPLREAIVSFMISRRSSGIPIEVEYEHIDQRELTGTGPFSQQATIEMLSEDILLIVFHHYLDPTTRIWPTLARVCQRWRQIVFSSPLGLDLRVYCTYGMPVLKTLDCWPALPIVIQYGGKADLDPPAPEDYDHVIAALKQTARICSINLTVPSLLIEKLSAISEPFFGLEELVLLPQDNVQLTLPSTFQWGPRLLTLHSTRTAFLSLPQILSTSRNLIYLELHEIPRDGYFHPEAFANALTGMAQLQTLTLHFLSLPPRRNYIRLPLPPEERVFLPALTYLIYRGTSKYLDTLVARIDAPHLRYISITFFSQPTIDASQLGRFVDRIEYLKSPKRAIIKTSEHFISISFTTTRRVYPRLRLQISCKQLDWQLSSMAQVCDQFSPFIFRVDNLSINTTQSPPRQDDVDSGQWLELVRSFGGASDFWLAGEFTTEILNALGPAEREHTAVLPVLRHLQVEKHMSVNEPSWAAIRKFNTWRWLSDRPVRVSARGFSCHICYAQLTEDGLTLHLRDSHGYRMVCSYCSDFEYTPGHYHHFRKHLRSEHPELVRNDPLIPDPSPLSLSFLRDSSPRGMLDDFVYRHSFARAPGTLLHDGHGPTPIAHSDSDSNFFTDSDFYSDSDSDSD